MNIAEWALRSLPHHWFTHFPALVEPIAYGIHSAGPERLSDSTRRQPEWYYMQADLHGLLLQDLDFECGAVPLLRTALQRSSDTWQHLTQPGSSSIQLTQAPRLWLSPGGAVSPLHFDLSLSHLVQVHGSKHMLFHAPDRLRFLDPFPAGHMLARRCDSVDRGSADQARDVARQEYATTLFPGDIVVFAPLWSHHTTSLSTSASVTVRVQCG